MTATLLQLPYMPARQTDCKQLNVFLFYALLAEKLDLQLITMKHTLLFTMFCFAVLQFLFNNHKHFSLPCFALQFFNSFSTTNPNCTLREKQNSHLRNSWRTRTVQWGNQWWAAHGIWRQSGRRPAGSDVYWRSAWPWGIQWSLLLTGSQSKWPATGKTRCNESGVIFKSDQPLNNK